MRKRWNANTWVVAILFTLIGLIGFDVARQMMQAAKVAATPPPTPATMEPKFKVGDKAPDFTLPDAKGKKVTFSNLVKGETMVWFTCGCANCMEVQEYMASLSKKLGPKAPTIVNVTTMLPEREETWLRDTKLKQTVLYEPNSQGPVGTEYKGHPCPRYFRVKADRTVAKIGPSPRIVADMKMMAANLAGDLGFAMEGSKATRGQPIAPTPKFRETSPEPPSSSTMHGPDDGHNH